MVQISCVTMRNTFLAQRCGINNGINHVGFRIWRRNPAGFPKVLYSHGTRGIEPSLRIPDRSPSPHSLQNSEVPAVGRTGTAAEVLQRKSDKKRANGMREHPLRYKGSSRYFWNVSFSSTHSCDSRVFTFFNQFPETAGFAQFFVFCQR